MGVKGEVVPAGLQGVRAVVGAQAQRMEDAHEDFAGAGARMLDRRAAVEGHQAREDRRQQAGHPVHGGHEASDAHPELARHGARGNSIEIMLCGHVHQQAVAEQALGRHAGRAGLNGASTPGTAPAGEVDGCREFPTL